MVSVNSPCGEIILHYCLARSLKLPELEFDDIGIQPDFFMDRTIPDYKWLDHIMSIME